LYEEIVTLPALSKSTSGIVSFVIFR
jgi:hypothetical protein